MYEVEGPAFFASNVLVAATEGREFHYGAVGQPGEQWLMWGSTQDPYDMFGFERVQRSVDLLLSPAGCCRSCGTSRCSSRSPVGVCGS